MARTLYGVMMQAARAAERSRREAARAQARMLREAERERKQSIRAAQILSREERQAYLAGRQSEIDEFNDDLALRIDELRGILNAAPECAVPLNFMAMKKQYRPLPFNTEAVAGPMPEVPNRSTFYTRVKPPSFIASIFGGKAKYVAAKAAAAAADQKAFDTAMAEYERALAEWHEVVAAERSNFEALEKAREAEVQHHNAAIDAYASAYEQGDVPAVLEYFGQVLDRSLLPDEFPEDYRLAYVPESRQLVVEHWLPTVDIIPTIAEFAYIKTKDEVREKPRKKAEVKDLYESVIAQTCLRILNELFATDRANVVSTIVLNGVVDTISPTTGEHIRPCIVSVRATREEFGRLVLNRIEPVSCLRALGAVSKKPEELTPVRPVMEFDMADRRYVTEADIISNLDTRNNIMDLTPSEFESLVTNLFSGMGLEAKQTRSSRDGGVDAVAYDARPVLGGKVVIQAKRYRNTVGVAAVRDLYGTMMNEGANKGILVTTAGYGPDAFSFAKDKPIELIDGPGLLFLLAEQGIEAKIVVPEQ